jgi:chromate transporter
LFLCFLRIGSTAFGGFMALISVVQSEVVERRKLLLHSDVLDGISLATVLPGPIAVNVVAYVGYKLRGGTGALVSTVGVILPAFILIVALSAAYFRWGRVPEINKLFLGFVPAVVALIAHGAWGLARKAIAGLPESIIAVLAFLLLLYEGGGYVTVLTMGGAGLLGWLLFARLSKASPVTRSSPAVNRRARKKGGVRLLSLNAPLAGTLMLALDLGLAGKLLLTFAGMSLFLFGGGYVLIPLIEHIVVQEHGWLTRQELADAIALGQVTPGPIAISAAFIGYKVMGLLGAVIATVGIFLPPAVLMVISTRFLMHLRGSTDLQAVLRGIRPAVVGMIGAVAFSIATTATPSWQSGLVFVAALLALFRTRVDAVWIVPAAGLVGLLIY